MIEGYPPVVQTLLGTGLTWAVTALGASFCLFHYSGKNARYKQNLLLDGSLGFSAGVMLAASFWSLLEPGLAMARDELHMGAFSLVPLVMGLIFGTAFVGLASHLLPTEWLVSEPVTETESSEYSCHAHNSIIQNSAEDSDNSVRLRRPPSPGEVECSIDNGPFLSPSPQIDRFVINHRLWLLIIAVTVHNIPEGLAVGIAFGGAESDSIKWTNARNLAIGIAIQNFPEGLAVSLPLRAAGYGFWKSFWFGQLSGLVEPAAGLLGCVGMHLFHRIQPFALAFAAGAMLFVVFDDVIPEAQSRGNGHFASIAAMGGFIAMMILDVVTTMD